MASRDPAILAATRPSRLRKQGKIADCLTAGKDERARIRVEHIIREDYLVEAMEMLELYCDLLLARFSLIQATKLSPNRPGQCWIS
ncbi:IST1 homolog [Halichoerus grypus]|uniref:IST1 homolog isoform X3 n=1 Tax=Halichoerus grypus TaxID=9711 RepID=UPI0016594902|nr:IST1 homolog isoform X3 [Halichoerus grypus]